MAVARRGSEEVNKQGSVQDKPVRFGANKLPADPAVVNEMKDEILTLRRRIRDLERHGAVPAPIKPDRRAEMAEDLYREMSDPHLYQDVKRWLKASGRLADLDPSMAPIFISKFRAKQPNGDPLALELAIGCGGPEVVALLKEIFANPQRPKTQRHVAGVCMTGMGLLSQIQPEYLPDHALVDLASRYIGSADPADRRSAIGLLRLQRGDASRSQLMHILSYDQDESAC